MEDNAPPPGWIGLLIAGISNMLYGLFNLVWSLVSMAWGGFAAVSMALDSSSSDGDVGGTILAVIIALSPIINVLIFIAVPLFAAVTLFAALRFKSHRSKGLVWLGILAAFGAPLLAFLGSFTSFCNLTACPGCCIGFLGGNVLTIVDLVVVTASCGFAIYALTRPETAAAFEANA